MSKISIEGNALGTGTFTIASPNSNTSRSITLPDAAGAVVLDTATQTLTNKTLTSPTLTTPNIDSAQFATVSGTAPIYACRAWVNFDGTGTPAIRASGNVSSITDNGTDNYTVNFTTAMPDVNYATSVYATRDSTINQTFWGNGIFPTYVQNSGSVQVANTCSPGNSSSDPFRCCVAVFR
jgi:hypothetical protein